MTLLEIVCRQGIKHNEKIRELQEFLNKNIEIPIDKELFKSALFTKDIIDIRKDMVYLILHHCIAHDSAISDKKEKLSFQNAMNILDEAVHDYIIVFPKINDKGIIKYLYPFRGMVRIKKN